MEYIHKRLVVSGYARFKLEFVFAGILLRNVNCSSKLADSIRDYGEMMVEDAIYFKQRMAENGYESMEYDKPDMILGPYTGIIKDNVYEPHASITEDGKLSMYMRGWLHAPFAKESVDRVCRMMDIELVEDSNN